MLARAALLQNPNLHRPPLDQRNCIDLTNLSRGLTFLDKVNTSCPRPKAIRPREHGGVLIRSD
jgi:hypothetical protein